MTHYKDVDGERLLCWGRPGDTYKVYMDEYTKVQTDSWFQALGDAAEASWETEYPVLIFEVTLSRDYGYDRVKNIVAVSKVTCDDDYNVTVEHLNEI